MKCPLCTGKAYVVAFIFSLFAVAVPVGHLAEVDLDLMLRDQCRERKIPLERCRVFTVRNVYLTNTPLPGDRIVWQGDAEDENGNPYEYVVARAA